MSNLGNPIDPVALDKDARTLDEALRRDPTTISDEDLEAIVRTLRHQREVFLSKEDKAKAKKEGVDLETATFGGGEEEEV